MNRVRTSVIIPTRDSAGPLRRCLEALAVSFPADAETIVVSDGGPSDVDCLFPDLVARLSLRSVQVAHGGPGYARNRGLEIARGDIVAFTDDDCVPRPGWLDAISTAVNVAAGRAAGGVTFNGLAANPYADAAQLVLDLVARHETDCCGEVRFFPANNCAFPAGALRALGGFDESFRTAEDRELLRRWRAAEHEMHVVTAAVVDHEASPGFTGFVRKFYGYGQGAARFHATDRDKSWSDSASFHRRLPLLLGPELRKRSLQRRAALIGLLGVWELANLAGMLSASASGNGHSSSNGHGA